MFLIVYTRRILPELRQLYEYQTHPVGDRFAAVAVNNLPIGQPLPVETVGGKVEERDAYHRLVAVIPLPRLSLLRHGARSVEETVNIP